MKFSGKNFQSWSNFDLDLNGFVVIFGPSRVGKSALIRALRGIIRNEVPEQRIKTPRQETLELSLEMDGHVVSLERKAGGSTKYVIDGKPFTSLGKKVPQALEALKLGEVEVGEFSVDPIFAAQHGRPFLLESGPTELNTMLGAFASTEKLEAGKKQANLIITQKNSDARTLADQIGETEERRERLDKILALSVPVYTALKTLEPQAQHAEATSSWLQQATTKQRRLIPLRVISEALTLPDAADAERLQDVVLSLHSASTAKVRCTHLRAIDLRLQQAVDIWNEIVQITRRGRVLNETMAVVGRVHAIQELDAARKLNEMIGIMETDLSSANQAHGSIKNAAQVLLLKQKIAEKRTELGGTETELNLLHETYGLCPKCGNPMEHVCGA